MSRPQAPGEAELLARQARFKIVAMLAMLGVIAALAWLWGRTDNRPQRVLIAIEIVDPSGDRAYEWDEPDERGPAAQASLTQELAGRLRLAGLEPLFDPRAQEPPTLDASAIARLRAASRDSLPALAAELGAGTLVRGRIQLERPPLTSSIECSDVLARVELEVIDTLSVDRSAVPGSPFVLHLRGVRPDDAVRLDTNRIANRVTWPLTAA